MKPKDPAYAASGVFEPGAGVYVQQDGITVRAYFAARAPHQPAVWFEPSMRDEPVSPVFEFPADFAGDVGARNYILNTVNGWRRDPIFDLGTASSSNDDLNALLDAVRPQLVAYEQAYVAWCTVLQEWRHERQVQVSAQWPWAWSDYVLAAAEVKR